MRHAADINTSAHFWPDFWKLAVIAVCTLILCSCRNPEGPCRGSSPYHCNGDSLPDSAYTGARMNCPNSCPGGNGAAPFGGACPAGPAGMEQRVPMPYVPQSAWSPAGLRQPWPEDEYLRDGGDEGKPAGPGKDREILGVDMEDTVACYNTLDRRTVVQPSNEVFLYSLCFGAVRQVVSLMASEERQKAGGVEKPVRANAPTTTQLVGNTEQNTQLGDEISARPASAFRMKQGNGAMSTAVRAKAFQDRFKAFENLSIIRLGQYEEAEMAFLARGANAAIAWSHTQAVQVILDRKSAMAEVKFDKAQMTYMVESPPGRPALRLVKVASTSFANPGDTVDFTIRFDNIGNQTIGNVAILDSLNTRLEFIPDSAQCSLDASFSTELNEGGSVILHCELANPLEVGKGGIFRFSCRVQ